MLKEFNSTMEWLNACDKSRGFENWLYYEDQDDGIVAAYYRTKDFTVSLQYNPKTKMGEV